MNLTPTTTTTATARDRPSRSTLLRRDLKAAKGVLQFASKASLRDANALLRSYKVSRDCRGGGCFTGVDETFRGFLSRDGCSAAALTHPTRTKNKTKKFRPRLSLRLASCLGFCVRLATCGFPPLSSPTFARPNAESCSLQQGPFAGQSAHSRYVLLMYYVMGIYAVGIRLHGSEVFFRTICFTAGPVSLSLSLSLSIRLCAGFIAVRANNRTSQRGCWSFAYCCSRLASTTPHQFFRSCLTCTGPTCPRTRPCSG